MRATLGVSVPAPMSADSSETNQYGSTLAAFFPSSRNDSLVVDLGKAAGLQLTDNFDRCHRLGRAEPGKTRPIMAKFLSANARQKLFDNRKDLTVGKVRGCHMGYHMVWL